MKLSVAEVLNKASKERNDLQKIKVLRENNSVALQTILRGAFDPKIKWLLPEGEPPYTPNKLSDQQHQFFHECRKMYLFIEGGNPNLKQQRREQLFIEILEMIDPSDAKLLLAVKDKKLPDQYKNITPAIVKQAFPGLIP